MPSSASAPTAPANSTRFSTALVVAIASGAVIAVQGKANGDLSSFGAGPFVASCYSYLGTFLTVAVVLALMGRLPRTFRIVRSSGAWWWFAVGACSVPLVVAMAVGIPAIGVAVTSVCSVAGQTVAGLILDSRGIGVEVPLHMTVRRAVAGLGALVGLVVAVTAGQGPSDTTLLGAIAIGVFLFVGGLLLAIQQAGNGSITATSGDPLIATLTSVSGGLLTVSVVTGIIAAFGGLGDIVMPNPATDWWPYLGGPLGMVITAASAFAVRRLGTFALTIAVVGGQLVMAVLLDVVDGLGAGAATLVSLAIIAGSVALTVIPTRTPTPSGKR